MIAAIPTEYKKVLFRSRLEATYAETLDIYGIHWQYEPRLIDLPSGRKYLPDFWLDEINAWLEVKGEHNRRIDKLEEFAAMLWGRSSASTPMDWNAPMVLLGRMRPFAGEGVATISTVGVRGPGKRYSCVATTCSNCSKSVVIALWQPDCRFCGFIQDDPLDWMDGEFKLLFRGMDTPARGARWNHGRMK